MNNTYYAYFLFKKNHTHKTRTMAQTSFTICTACIFLAIKATFLSIRQ